MELMTDDLGWAKENELAIVFKGLKQLKMQAHVFDHFRKVPSVQSWNQISIQLSRA